MSALSGCPASVLSMSHCDPTRKEAGYWHKVQLQTWLRRGSLLRRACCDHIAPVSSSSAHSSELMEQPAHSASNHRCWKQLPKHAFKVLRRKTQAAEMYVSKLLPSGVIVGINIHFPCFCFLPPYSSIQTRFSVSSTPHLALCRMSIPSLSSFRVWFPTRRRISSFSDHSCRPRCPRTTISSQRITLLSVVSEQTPKSLCLPAFDSVHKHSAPGPAFAPNTEYSVALVHHSSAFYSPRYVSASVDLHISPRGLFCNLRPLVPTVLHPPGLIVNYFSNGNSCSLVVVPINMSSVFLVSVGVCPPKTCWFWLSPPPRSNPSSSAPLRLPVRQDPTFVRRHKPAYLMISSLACLNVEPHLFSLSCWLNIPQDLP